LLEGDIGAGKTFFARSVIQYLLGRAEDVPSPTFTIVQNYSTKVGEIWHCDLYRLTSPDEAIELGLDEAFEKAICLIEWPDRLGDLTPKAALQLKFSAGESQYSIEVFSSLDWQIRLERAFE
jgi:tRNA threonylcarbamoyladenosine biosynthesis protein TsaE